jgi:S1-C subfamily serine protease
MQNENDAASGNEPEDAAVEVESAPVTVPGIWQKRPFRIGASVTAIVVALGIGFGVTAAVRSPSATSRIPSAPAKNATFVEDDDGAGQDQQENILSSSAEGVVHIQAASGAFLSSGMVITRSGYVLTSYSGLEGTGTLQARFVMSGKSYPAHLVGSDPVANLALLQLTGGSDFKPVTIGTASAVSLDDRVASAGGNGADRGILLSTGDIVGINLPATVDGHRLTGLLEVTSLDLPGDEVGGPLLNLSGQVLGVDIAARAPHAPGGDGYAVPIDSALRIAQEIAGQ